MTSLYEAWNNTGTTENGMPTKLSSMDSVLDLFFLSGASRNKDISLQFLKAFNQNPDLTVRILLWLRDIRQGAGERQTFKTLLLELYRLDVDRTKKVLPLIPIIGRWDDLLCLVGTSVQQDVFNLIKEALDANNALCAKWMPRKGYIAVILRNALGLSPKQYRKMLVEKTKVVETAMCANNWSDINYNHIPSIAASRYQAAFNRHDPGGYLEYKDKLSTGEAKINASAIFPHEIVKSVSKGDAVVANNQWKALPNYMQDSTERILPICDVSGSMQGLPMEVSIGLGLYISERNVGEFKDMVCTFSERPSLIKLASDTLSNRVKELSKIPWGMNTNLDKIFEAVLDTASKYNVPASNMPTMLLIISDMEFDYCVNNNTAFGMIKTRYDTSGYTLPKVVFWNVKGRSGNVPVVYNEDGVALVSGFSPSILTGLLSGENFSPIDIMMKVIMNNRYNCNG
jgi:hypothetical protein